VIKQKSGADPAAVVYDAVAAAKGALFGRGHRGHGRTTAHQIQSDGRVGKNEAHGGEGDPGAPHDILLVLDATTGQNGLAQAREFTSTVGVTGIILTKLDGTARVASSWPSRAKLSLPIRFVGTGEQINDLVPFDAETYVNSSSTDSWTHTTFVSWNTR